MKNRKNAQYQPFSILEKMVFFYLFIMIAIFPFYFHEWYLDIIRAKKNFFEICTVIFLLLFLLGILFFLAEKKQLLQIKGNLTDVFAILFLISVWISCCMSPYGKEAFLGETNRRLGGIFLMLCIGAYFAISRFYRTSKILIWTFFIVNILLCIFVILQFWGIDLFHMYKNLAENQHTIFIGTLGNINFNASYFGTIVPIVMGCYVVAKEKRVKITTFLLIVIGIYTCYCTRSDSWLLAIFVAYFLLLWLSYDDEKRRVVWWQLGVAFFTSSILMKITIVLVNTAGWDNLFVRNFMKHKLMISLVSMPILALEAVCLLLLYLLGKSRWINWLKKHGNKFMLAITILSIILVAFSIFPLEDSFGNDRGYIWKRTIRTFFEYPLHQKLFGYGPNCFLYALEPKYGAEMMELYGAVFVDAHNEFLQFLAVTGILGAVSYIGMQVSLLVSFLYYKQKDSVTIIACLGLLAYLAQGLVNNPQVFTTPLLFILLGILQKKYLENY